MSLISGLIGRSGAVVTVLVGPDAVRSRLLRKMGFAVPEPVAVSAIVDTGAEISAISPRVVRAIDLTPVATTSLLTPSTSFGEPHQTDVYVIGVTLASATGSHHIPSLRAIATDCFRPYENAEALIGLDILNRCVFEYAGIHGTFRLAFLDDESARA